MKTAVSHILLFCLLTIGNAFSGNGTANEEKHNLELSFTPVTAGKGKVFYRILNENGQLVYEEILNAKEGTLSSTVSLPRGKYAVSAFYDVNDNGALDRNFFGIPSEPYGFSNNVRGGVTGPPSLREQLVSVLAPTQLTISLE